MAKKRLKKIIVNPLVAQINRLLQRNHRPTAEARATSLILGAGRGVFCTQAVAKDAVVCLYPGVYSAGLPPGTEVGPLLRDDVTFMGHLMPPSRQRFQDFNSYILNIPDPPTGRVGPVSGYIDGMALEVVDVLLRDFHNAAYDERVTQRLDENPSACGHFVNHSSLAANANVRVVPFAWEDIVPNFQFGDEATFDLPNIARKDGAPHFMYSHGSVMIFYDTGGLSFSVKGVGGAALCAMEDLDEGQELLRDYDLEEPMPRWAADWYTLPPSDSDCDSDDDETQDEDAWRLIP